MFANNKSLADASQINDWNIASGNNFTKMFCVENAGHCALPEFSKRKGSFDNDGTFMPE